MIQIITPGGRRKGDLAQIELTEEALRILSKDPSVTEDERDYFIKRYSSYGFNRENLAANTGRSGNPDRFGKFIAKRKELALQAIVPVEIREVEIEEGKIKEKEGGTSYADVSPAEVVTVNSESKQKPGWWRRQYDKVFTPPDLTPDAPAPGTSPKPMAVELVTANTRASRPGASLAG
jgi:hypothetical protein